MWFNNICCVVCIGRRSSMPGPTVTAPALSLKYGRTSEYKYIPNTSPQVFNVSSDTPAWHWKLSTSSDTVQFTKLSYGSMADQSAGFRVNWVTTEWLVSESC